MRRRVTPIDPALGPPIASSTASFFQCAETGQRGRKRRIGCLREGQRAGEREKEREREAHEMSAKKEEDVHMSVSSLRQRPANYDLVARVGNDEQVGQAVCLTPAANARTEKRGGEDDRGRREKCENRRQVDSNSSVFSGALCGWLRVACCRRVSSNRNQGHGRGSTRKRGERERERESGDSERDTKKEDRRFHR